MFDPDGNRIQLAQDVAGDTPAMIVRRGGPQDVRFLRDMLHHAFYWREQDPASTSMRYVRAWGRPGDSAVIALEDGFPVGAAWYRLFPAGEPGFGYVDERTPELAIAVVPSKRGQGVGDALLRALLDDGRRRRLRRPQPLRRLGERRRDQALREARLRACVRRRRVTDDGRDAGVTQPPQIRLLHLIGGFMVTQTIGAAVRLGIPDLVAERPRPVAELAEATGADPDALGRVICGRSRRVGVFAEEDGVVRHTELSELLRSDVPVSLEASTRLFSGLHYRTWSDAFETFRTGEPAFPRVHGQPMFDWFGEHPEEAAVFNRAMAQVAPSGDGCVCSSATGRGVRDRRRRRRRHRRDAHRAARARTRTCTGIVFDLEHAREGAERTIAAAGARRPLLVRRRQLLRDRAPRVRTSTSSPRSSTTGTTSAPAAILRSCRDGGAPGLAADPRRGDHRRAATSPTG